LSSFALALRFGFRKLRIRREPTKATPMNRSVANGSRPSLSDFLSRRGSNAGTIFVCKGGRFEGLRQADDFLLQPNGPGAYDLDGGRRSFAVSQDDLSNSLVAALPRSIWRRLEYADLVVVDAGLIGDRLSPILQALSLDNEPRSLALFLDGADPDLADWDEGAAFALITARLIKFYKERCRGFRLGDGLLIYCDGINLKFAATPAFDVTATRTGPSEAREFFSDSEPAPGQERVAAVAADGAGIVAWDALHASVSAETRTLQAEERVPLPGADWILDLSGGRTPDFAKPETEIVTAECALHRIHSHAVVRGTNVLLLPGNKLLPIRQLAPAAAREFEGYLRTARNWSDQAESFHSNLYFRDQSVLLGEKEVVVVDDHLFLLTPDEYLNYGMWLLQAVPGLRLCENEAYAGAILCPGALPWQRSIIDFVAPTASRRWVAHSPNFDYLSSGAVSFIGCSRRSFWIGDFQREAYAELRERARGPHTGGREKGSDKIYISRLQHNATSFSNRVLVNEIELILRLSALGFRIVSPETLSFPEQIRLFAEARVVIGPGGAAMFNCVFCRPGAAVVTIESNANWVTNHCHLFGSLGLNYAIAFGEPLDPAGGPHAPWRLDVDAFISHIRPNLGLS
jgi:capsular polysaccharide biosynthesis protein